MLLGLFTVKSKTKTQQPPPQAKKTPQEQGQEVCFLNFHAHKCAELQSF